MLPRNLGLYAVTTPTVMLPKSALATPEQSSAVGGGTASMAIAVVSGFRA